jgi:sulfite reductase (NADPH) flavoprotein alpha-component
MRYAVLGIGDRSYDDFCGYAKSLDARLAELGATKLVERIECEAYDDEPMARWADEVTTLVGATAADRAPAVPPSRRSPTAEPFTRNSPVDVPLSRNTVLTAPGSAKELRQFGFDVSEHTATYSVGDAFGGVRHQQRADGEEMAYGHRTGHRRRDRGRRNGDAAR